MMKSQIHGILQLMKKFKVSSFIYQLGHQLQLVLHLFTTVYQVKVVQYI